MHVWCICSVMIVVKCMFSQPDCYVHAKTSEMVCANLGRQLFKVNCSGTSLMLKARVCVCENITYEVVFIE